MPSGKGIKDPSDPKSNDTCDCYDEGEKWNIKDKEVVKDKEVLKDKDVIKDKDILKDKDGKSEEEDSEERKESFEAVQFKSNQTKEKGFFFLRE